MKAGTALIIAVLGAAAMAVFGVVVQLVFRLAAPQYLWLLLAPAGMIAAYAFYWWWRRRTEEEIGHLASIRSMAASSSPRKHVARFVLVVLSVMLLVVSTARPQWGEMAREVERRGIDVVIALDISRSMLAEDVAPSRFDAAVREIDALLRRLEGDRVGLVVFAGIAFVQSPLTSDYGAIRLYLDRLHPEDLEIQGTAIQLALDESVELLTGGEDEDFERADNQMIVVISDGEDHEGDPLGSARDAAEEGIHVYTVGIGTEQGGRIPIRNRDGSVREYHEDRRGNVVVTTLIEGQLMEVADAANAEYSRYEGDGTIADFVVDAVEAYDAQMLESLLREEYVDRYLFFLIPAFFLLLIATALGERRSPKNIARVGAAALVALTLAGCEDALLRPDPAVEEAIARSAQGQHEAAIQALIEAPEEAWETPELHFDRGLFHERAGELDDAREGYFESVQSPDDRLEADSLVGIGNTLMADEDYETAIERFRRALLVDPEHDAARHNLEVALRLAFPPCSELDDELEDNDSAETASEVPQQMLTGTYAPPTPEDAEDPPELVACGRDADWYVLPVLGGDTFNITADFRRLRSDTGAAPPPDEIAATDVHIALMGPDAENAIAVDQGLDDVGESLGVPGRRVERALAEVLIPEEFGEAGFVFLRIEVEGELEYDYELEVEWIPPCSAMEDDYEDNDDRLSATQMADEPMQARLCEGDDDWYTRTIGPGDSLFVDIPPLALDDQESAPLEVTVYMDDETHPHDVMVIDEEEGVGEVALIEVEEETTVSFRVSTMGGQEGSYQLGIYYFPPCPEGNDRFEPNDGPDLGSIAPNPNPGSPGGSPPGVGRLPGAPGGNNPPGGAPPNTVPPGRYPGRPPTTPGIGAPPTGDMAQINAEEQPFRHLRLCEGDEDWFVVTLPQEEEEEGADAEGEGEEADAEPEDEAFSALAAYREPSRFVSVDLYSDSMELMARGIPEWALRQAPGDPAGSGEAPPEDPGPEEGPAPEADPNEPVPADEMQAVVAATMLEPDVEQVIVRVSGEPGFYHLSFPDTQSSQQQHEQQDSDEGEDSEEEEDSEEQDSQADSEQQDDVDPQDSEEEEDAEEQEEQDASSEDEEEAEQEESEVAEEEEMSEEELERMMLMNLLNSLDAADVNLPLQQALENVPYSQHEQDW